MANNLEQPDADPGAAPGPGEEELRAKFDDYCSALLTDVFVALPAARVYKMAEDEARAQGFNGAELSSRDLVRLATKHLRKSVPLPDYETWRRDYLAEPERFEEFLMGLWRQREES